MQCQESDRGMELLNEVRAKGFGSSSSNGDAGRTQKAGRRGKAPCCVASRKTGERGFAASMMVGSIFDIGTSNAPTFERFTPSRKPLPRSSSKMVATYG